MDVFMDIQMADFLVGKTYTWNKGVIKFITNSVLITSWEIGVYMVVGPRNVIATWHGLTHNLTFNDDFTQYESRRTPDNNVVIGVLMPPAEKTTIPSVFVDYKDRRTALCDLGRKYNVDKSSQRDNPGPADSQHCHPYSILYDAFFRRRRDDPINFCEIGIAEGRSLLMWNDYFPKAAIYGFEYLDKWLDNWSKNYGDKERIHVNHMDVRADNDILVPLQNTGVQFDCIIDDSSHVFSHMIRVIHVAHKFLKPGGMMIIEDIRKAYEESWFNNELRGVIGEFQHVFFVELEHERRNSGIVQNDKVLVLIKKGAPSIFDQNLF